MCEPDGNNYADTIYPDPDGGGPVLPDVAETRLRCAHSYASPYDAPCSLDLNFHWFLVCFRLVCSDRALGTVTGDTVDVRCEMDKIWLLWDPCCRRQVRRTHVDAWAEEAEDGAAHHGYGVGHAPPIKDIYPPDEGSGDENHSDHSPSEHSMLYSPPDSSEGAGSEPDTPRDPKPVDPVIVHEDPPPEEPALDDGETSSTSSDDAHDDGLHEAIDKVTMPGCGVIGFIPATLQFVAVCNRGTHKDRRVCNKTALAITHQPN